MAYTKVATISTDTHHSSQEFRASVGAQWPFLSDPERTVQKDLQIQEYTDPEHDPMIPYTLVLKPGLIVHTIYNGYWFWGRPSFVDLWHDLRTVTREIRPTGISASPGCEKRGMRPTTRRFTGGTGAPAGDADVLQRLEGRAVAVSSSPLTARTRRALVDQATRYV